MCSESLGETANEWLSRNMRRATAANLCSLHEAINPKFIAGSGGTCTDYLEFDALHSKVSTSKCFKIQVLWTKIPESRSGHTEYC